MKSKQKMKMKVGFDLDGVLLYNPARVIRPLLKSGKSIFLKQKQTKFYVPQTKWQVFMWQLAHKSSLFIAPGVKQIEALVDQDLIEAYVITARFECLKNDYDRWMKRLNKDHIFTNSYYNHQNEQPHIYKQKMITKLKIDLFIEDNWDIVEHLDHNKHRSNLKRALWVSNIFDKPIPYKHKHNSLSSAMDAVTNFIQQP